MIFTLAALSALTIVSYAGNPSLYPCPGDKKLLAASCQFVSLPSNLCTICHLNPPLDDGKFKDCANIYSKNKRCLSKMNEYVKANSCDDIRGKAMGKINAGIANWKDWISIDYFLYSICEQCCDCIPMGADRSHLGQWIITRGNCPAHSVYDVCEIFPNATHFKKIGEFKPQFFGMLQVRPCDQLQQWKKSPHSVGWGKKAFTHLSSDIMDYLASIMDAASCSAPRIWNACFNLESKQNNLGKPGTFDGSGMFSRQGVPTPTSTSTERSKSSSDSATTSDNLNSKVGTNNMQPQIDTTGVTEAATSNTNTERARVQPQTSGTNSAGSPVTAEPFEPIKTDKIETSCSGEVRWGCLDWNATAKVCKKHGPKCFPTPPPEIANCKGEVRWGCLNWNSAKHICTKHGLKCFPTTSARFQRACVFNGQCKQI